jgi:hypothetical protein
VIRRGEAPGQTMEAGVQLSWLPGQAHPLPILVRSGFCADSSSSWCVTGPGPGRAGGGVGVREQTSQRPVETLIGPCTSQQRRTHSSRYGCRRQRNHDCGSSDESRRQRISFPVPLNGPATRSHRHGHESATSLLLPCREAAPYHEIRAPDLELDLPGTSTGRAAVATVQFRPRLDCLRERPSLSDRTMPPAQAPTTPVRPARPSRPFRPACRCLD